MSVETALAIKTDSASNDMSEHMTAKNNTVTDNNSDNVQVLLNENEIEKERMTPPSVPLASSEDQHFAAGEKMTFRLIYFGEESLDRRFTQSMLPWILAEVRRRTERRMAVVQLSNKTLLCIDEETGAISFEHRLQGISRICRCQRDKRCFTYLYKINADADFNCHVFQAVDSDTVHKFANAIREATREAVKEDQHAKVHGKLPVTECLIDGNSSNFEVLYCGKIVVSHKKAPPTLIDDTIQKFKDYEERKQRKRSVQNDEEKDVEEKDLSKEKVDGRTNTDNMDLEDEEKETQSQEAKNQSVKNKEKENKDSKSNQKKSKSAESQNEAKRSMHSTESDQNRTILLHIGRNDISLISLNNKNFMLTKRFKEISFCSQGIKHPEYFGFICREKTSTSSYMCYVFRCQTAAVVDEILLTLRQAFHSALQTSHVICETCPMHQLHKLCLEIEGQSSSKVHKLLLKRLENLNDSQHAEIVAMLKENSVNDQEENEIIMAFLRSVCESKQKTHSHISDNGTQRESPKLLGNTESAKPMSKFDLFKNKAKKSLSSSFDNIRAFRHRSGSGSSTDQRSRDENGVFNTGYRSRSNTNEQEESPAKLSEMTDSPQSAPPTPAKLKKTHSQDTEDYTRCTKLPSPEMRKRSSTIGEIPISPTSPMSPTSPKYFTFTTPKRQEDRKPESPAVKILRRQMSEMPSTPGPMSPRRGSWRQAIFNSVVTPLHHHHHHDESQPSMTKDYSRDLDELGCEGPGNTELSSLTERKPRKPKSRFKSRAAIKALWRKAILEQILLLRMEKENKNLQAHQDAASTKREKLDYEEITPCLREITAIWDEMMQAAKKDDIDYNYNTLLKSVKAGVPRMRRGEIWKFLIGQHAKSNHGVFEPPPNNYEELLKQLTSHQHAILLDLGRTFPSHPYFSTQLGPGQLSLFNLLKAYSLLDTEVGYCQGLSFVAGILLMHMKEEEAFEMLKYMMFQLGIRGQYKPDMQFLQLQMYQLSRLLHDYYRPLHDHLEQHDIAPSLYAAPWFLTLFASQFPLGFVARVFDLLFLQGMEVVTKVALIILGSHSELILQCDTFEGIVDFLKNTLPSLGIIQMERTINQVFELDISRPLHAYEVEYHVLQEEMIHSPLRSDDDLVEKLETNNRNLKRQNVELLEELQKVHTTIHSYEATLGSMQATTNKYKSQVKALELERTALLNTVAQLKKLIPDDKLLEAGINTSPMNSNTTPSTTKTFTLGEVKEMHASPTEDTNTCGDNSLLKSQTNSSFEDDLDMEVAGITRVHELRLRDRHFSGESITSTCSEISSSASESNQRPESNQS
ncbi:TBC1 domain family member 1-like isoform X2 [Glandiceps talaboti]